MDSSAYSFPETVNNYIASPEFGGFSDEQKPLALESFRRQFISENGITDQEHLDLIDQSAKEKFDEYRHALNIPRYTPTPEQAQELFGQIKINPQDTIEDKIKAVESWRDSGKENAAKLLPANREDNEIYIEDLANNYIRQIQGEADYGKESGVSLKDLSKRFVEGLGAKEIYNLIDYKESGRFFAKNLVENPLNDESTISQIAGGAGQFLGQGAIALGLGAIDQPELIAPAFFALFGATGMQEAYQREIKRTGDELRAQSAMVDAIPGVVLDVGPEVFIVKGAAKSLRFAEKFLAATSQDAKRAVLKEFLPSIIEQGIKGAASEGIIGGAGANIAYNLGDYAATSDPKYLKAAQDIGAISQDALVSGILGGVFGAGYSAIGASGSKQNVSKTLQVLTQNKVKSKDILEALKTKDYNKVIDLVNGKTISLEDYEFVKDLHKASQEVASMPDGDLKDQAEKKLSERFGADTYEQVKQHNANAPYRNAIDKTIERLKQSEGNEAKITELEKARIKLQDENGKPVAFQPSTEFDSNISLDSSLEDKKSDPAQPHDVTLEDKTTIKNEDVVYVNPGNIKDAANKFIKNANLINLISGRVDLVTSPNGTKVKLSKSKNAPSYEAKHNPEKGWIPVKVSNGKIKILSPVESFKSTAQKTTDSKEPLSPDELKKKNEQKPVVEKVVEPIIETKTPEQINSVVDKLNQANPENPVAAPKVKKPLTRKKNNGKKESKKEEVVQKVEQQKDDEKLLEPTTASQAESQSKEADPAWHVKSLQDGIEYHKMIIASDTVSEESKKRSQDLINKLQAELDKLAPINSEIITEKPKTLNELKSTHADLIAKVRDRTATDEEKTREKEVRAEIKKLESSTKSEEEILKEKIDAARALNKGIIENQRKNTPENTKRRKEQTKAIQSLANDVGLKDVTIVNTNEELNDSRLNLEHQAFVEDGKATFILDNIVPYQGESHVEAVRRIFKHEVVGHLKVSQILSGISPEGFNNLVTFLKKQTYKDGTNVWKEREAAYKTEEDRDPKEIEKEIVDEIFAKLAEMRDKKSRGLIQKIINWIRINLLKSGNANWTANDIETIMQEAFHTDLASEQQGDVAFSKNVNAVHLNSSLKGMYGAWITPNGTIDEVNYQDHFGYALEKIGEENVTSVDQVYNELYNRGYLRAVNTSDGVFVEGHKLTPSQRAALDFIGINDEKNVKFNNKTIYSKPSEIRFSRITPEQDQQYLKTVESGDMEKAKRMVDEAARAAGYKQEAYHSSSSKEKIYEFISGKGHFGTKNQSDNNAFNSFGELDAKNQIRVYLDTSNLKREEDAKNNWSSIIKQAKLEGYDGIVYANKYEPDSPITNRVKNYDKNKEELDKINPWDKHGFFSLQNEEVAEKFSKLSDDVKSVAFFNKGNLWLADRNIAIKDGKIADSYVFINPSKIKSADPVTRDDNGNIIPLSKRFNDANNDIRFSKADTYTENFKSWFGDWENNPEESSKVVDEKGEPLVVYHGTQKNTAWSPDDFTVFFPLSHFGTAKAANERIMRDDDTAVFSELPGQRLYPVYLNIRNPLTMPDFGMGHMSINFFSEVIAQNLISEEAANKFTRDFVQDEIKKGIADDSSSDRATIALIKSLGIDGFKYINRVEDEGSISWVAIDPNQIKSATGNTGEFNPNNPDIRFSKSSEKGQIGFDKQQMLRLLGPQMYNKPIAQVAIKELLQNSFDALKAKKSDSKNIDITVDADNRTIKIKDDGVGMTPDIVKKAFLTIGGTNKDGLSESQRSGGLGLAKVQFLLGSDYVNITTVRDGLKTSIHATSLELYEDNFEIHKEKTNEPNGTEVEVKIPKSYTTLDGTEKEIYFPVNSSNFSGFSRFDILTKPLIGNVNVTYNGKPLPLGNNIKPGDDKYFLESYYGDNENYKSGDIVTAEQLKGLNKSDYYAKRIVSPALYSDATFDWGDANIYISENKQEEPRHLVLSSGLYQFSKPLYDLSYQLIPYDVVIDFKPKVAASSEQYPFNNQREGFKPTVEEDIKSLELFILQFASGQNNKEVANIFKDIKQLPKTNASEILTPEEREKIFASVDEINRKNREIQYTEKEIREIKKIHVSKGFVKDSKTKEVLVENKSGFKSSFKATKKLEESPVKDISGMDQNLPQYHNNTNFDWLSIDGAGLYFSDLGSVLHDLVRFYGNNVSRFEKLKGEEEKFFTGISINKGNGGIHIKKLFNAIFINPLAFDAKNKEEAIGIALHTMLHEINHTVAWEEGAGFTTEFAKTYGKLYQSGKYGYFESLLRSVYSKHFDTFQELKKQYDKSTTTNISKGFGGSNIEGSRDGSTQSDEANVSSRQDAGERDSGNRSDDLGLGEQDATGEIILSNINKFENTDTRFSKKDVQQQSDVLDHIFENTDPTSESKSTVTKEYGQLLKQLGRLEQKLIINEVNVKNGFKDIQYAYLDEDTTKRLVGDLRNFVETRTRQEEPPTDRTEIDKLQENLANYKAQANQGEYNYWKSEFEKYPDLESLPSFDEFFKGDIGLVRSYVNEILGKNEGEGINPSVEYTNEDVATVDAITDRQFYLIDHADEQGDIINRYFAGAEELLKSTGNEHLDGVRELAYRRMMNLKKIYTEFILNLATTDSTDLTPKQRRNLYYQLMSVTTDGYPNGINNFISNDLTNMMKQVENNYVNPYSTKNKTLASKLENIPSQIARVAANREGLDAMARLQASLREGLRLAKIAHEGFITPYIESQVQKYFNGVLDADLGNKIGMFMHARQHFLTETNQDWLKANYDWIKRSNRNLRIFDKSYHDQADRHDNYLAALYDNINIKGELTQDDVDQFNLNAEKLIGTEGIAFADSIVDMFDALKPLSKFTSEFVYGRTFDEIANYVPSMSVIIKGDGKYEVDNTEYQFMTDEKSVRTSANNKFINTTGGGTYKDRTRNIGENRTLVLNPQNLAVSVGRLMIYDSMTSHERQEISQITNPKTTVGKIFLKHLGDGATDNTGPNSLGRYSVVTRALKDMWNNELSQVSYVHPYHSLANWFARKWGQGRLSGAHQLPAQAVSNLIPYFVQHINEPRKIKNFIGAMLYWVKYKTGQLAPHQERLVNDILFEIRHRQQETWLDKSVNLNINPSSTVEFVKSELPLLYKSVRGADKALEHALLFPFKISDMLSGTPMMLAEYLNEYQDDPQTNRSHFQFEDLTYDPKIYIKALDKVERYIGVGDASRRGEFLGNRNAGISMARNLLVAFRSFTINNAGNFSAEYRKLTSSEVDPEMKIESLKYMTGIVAQSVVYSGVKIAIAGMVLRSIISAYKNPKEEEELKALYKKSQNRMSKKERKVLEAEIAMREAIKGTIKKVNERNLDKRIMLISTTKDALPNMFLFMNLDFIPDLAFHVGDIHQEQQFKDWKTGEIDRINSLIKRNKALGNTKTVAQLDEELKSIEMQQFLPAVFDNRGVTSLGGSFGGTVKELEAMTDSASKLFFKPEAIGINDFINLTSVMGVSQPDLVKYFKTGDKIEDAKRERDRKLNNIKNEKSLR